MARKSSKRLVYVLSSSSSDYGHSLGINSLAVDPVGSWLYTAGRDGVVNSWKFEGASLSGSKDLTDLNSEDLSPPIPNGVSSSSGSSTKHGKTSHCAKVPVHTNWVNDVILVNNYESLVSCSSDLTVKLWNPRDNSQHLIGRHRDYVKCLAAQTPQSTMVISGGLDRRIIAWDIETASEILSISTVDRETGNEPKSSVYALDITREANIIASGGPESIVRLFDARSADPILKFVGHNDNIRSLLISDDGKWVLSGSSDATIKLWSVAAARLMHTFDMHDDSVWSLYSQHPTLDVFYAADRSGLVTKTDLRAATVKNAWSTSSGGGEAFARSPSASSLDEVDSYNGVCSVVCNEHQGVSKLVAEGDYLWTATSNSCIHRWENFDTTPYSYKLFSRNNITKNNVASATSGLSTLLQSTNISNRDPSPHENNNEEDDDRSSIDHDIEALRHAHDHHDMEPLLGEPHEPHDSHHHLDEPHAAHHAAPTTAASDTQSVVSATSTAPTANTTALESDEDDKDKKDKEEGPPTVSFLHLDGIPALEFASSSVRAKPRDSITVVPVHQNPVETLEGHIGLIKHRLLTDRTRVLTLDTAGEVKLWDLLKCVPLRSYGTGHDLDELADQIMAYEAADGPTPVVVNWCTVTTRTGELFVTLEDGTCFDAEIYADEHEDIKDQFSAQDDHRVNLGRWVIKNLLNSVIRAEVDKDKANRRELRKTTSSNSLPTVSSVGERNNSANGSAHDAINSVVTQPVVQQTQAPAAQAANQAIPQKGKFMRSLRGFGKKKERSASNVGTAASSQSVSTVGSTSTLNTNATSSTNVNGSANPNNNNNTPPPPKEDKPEMTMQEVVQELEAAANKQGTPAYIPPSDQEAPPLNIPAHTKIMVSEMSPDSGGTMDLYRGTVGTVGEELVAFEKVAPEWIARLILRDELPAKDPHKVGFILHPYSETEPSIQSSYTSPANTDIRLSAYQMLRARKVLIYLVERLNQVSDTQYSPDQFELFCQDHPVKPELSLATIRTKLWRSGGDLVLKYKFK
ncbi:hypothetical protein TRVA0_021S01332 [Trichomonascus vanleenenianus]|uniref:WD repeat WDR48 family protein n=1 Tax=Trichomonascus vanleenenianus TaxID=2268995 RepID=UPI003ECB6F55